MNFKDVRSIYEHNLHNIKVRHERNIISDERAEGEIHSNFRWFQDIVEYYVERDFEVIRYVEMTNEEKQNYEHQEMGSVSYILKYLKYYIPVYIDDYGQQEVAIINGKEYGAGAYNMHSENYFCYRLDEIFQQEYLMTNDDN